MKEKFGLHIFYLFKKKLSPEPLNKGRFDHESSNSEFKTQDVWLCTWLFYSQMYKRKSGKYKSWVKKPGQPGFFKKVCERQKTRGFILTWKTVTMAHKRESKFFLSGSVSPSLSDPNLQPNRCIPRILTWEGGWKRWGGGNKQETAR